MNILYVTNKPIYPIVDGGCFAMDSFLRSLITCSEVKTISLSTYKHPFEKLNYPPQIVQLTDPSGHFIDTKPTVFSFLKSFFKNESYNVSRFYSESFLNLLINEIKTTSFDFVIFESAFLLVYTEKIRAVFKGKVVLRAPNVEYKIWEDYSHFSTSYFKKKLYKYLAKQLKKFEIEYVSKVDLLCVITENDKLHFSENGIKCPISVIPFGIEQKTHKLPSVPKQTLFFLGAYNWKPNYDAALFLVNQVLPELTKIYPDIELHLAGSFMPLEFNSFTSKNIKIHGKVDSSADFMEKHGVLVAPIFSGSGVRIKIIEALSIGVPVVASTIAMQGIPSNSVLLADTKQEFIDQICHLFNHPNSIEQYQKNAMQTIQNEFSFDHISTKLKALLDGI